MTREEAFSMLDRMAKGIAEMFGSNCETVINDLADPLHPVLAIYNGHVSGRTVGSTQDVTGVEQDLYLDTDVVNLLAVTPSGQQTKSSTFSIKGEDYHFGFGINYDFTPLAYANRVLLDLIHTEVDFHSALYKPRDTGIGELFDAAMLRVGKPVREMTKADRLRVIEHLKGMDAGPCPTWPAIWGSPATLFTNIWTRSAPNPLTKRRTRRSRIRRHHDHQAAH